MYTVPNLPYAYDALEPYIDKATMELHHDKHHAAYVAKLNTALAGNDALLSLDPIALMARLNEVPEDKRTAVRNNGGGHVNHSFFWEIMTPDGPHAPEGTLANAINTTFGSFQDFKTKFAEAAAGQFGSGWVWLCADGSQLHIETTPNQDNPWMNGHTPVLGLDVWEHAYYLKYQNKRPDYVEAWWNVVNWSKAGNNFTQTT